MARKLGQKTYSHLAHLDFRPGPYEISTTALLHHIDQGYAVNVDTKAWHEKYLINSPLSCKSYQNFVDPRKTYYGRYVEQQRDKEIYTFKIFEEIETTGYLKDLQPCAFLLFRKTLPVLRYVFQALQMSASYLGHLAPSSRIMIPLMFQSADEIRRIQLMAYLMGLFRRNDEKFGEQAQGDWQSDPDWQPLRQVLEKLLVTYDFGQSLIVLNAVIKPKIDLVLLNTISSLACDYQAILINNIFSSIKEDLLWHQQWFNALFDEMIEDKNQKTVIDTWIKEWNAPVNEAISIVVDKLLELQDEPCLI